MLLYSLVLVDRVCLRNSASVVDSRSAREGYEDSLNPEDQTWPSVVTRTVCCDPHATLMTSSGSSSSSSGLRLTSVGSPPNPPHCPVMSAPKVYSAPPFVMTHECKSPAAIVVGCSPSKKSMMESDIVDPGTEL